MKNLEQHPAPQHRWQFLRDVLVFQLKMFIGSFRDLALIPASLFAALIDLLFKGRREGDLFYRVLRWGWRTEEMIDVYSPIKSETAESKLNSDYTVDSVIARIEGVVVREYQKGGTAANIKNALDRVIDQVHDETRQKRDRARRIFARPSQTLRNTEGN